MNNKSILGRNIVFPGGIVIYPSELEFPPRIPTSLSNFPNKERNNDDVRKIIKKQKQKIERY